MMFRSSDWYRYISRKDLKRLQSKTNLTICRFSADPDVKRQHINYIDELISRLAAIEEALTKPKLYKKEN